MKEYYKNVCTSEGVFYAGSVAQTACPEGWHLPSKEEYETLITTVGGASAAAAAHVLKSTSGWDSGHNGTDEYGFRIVPDGFKDPDDSGYDNQGQGEFAFLWTSSVDKNSSPYYMHVSHHNEMDQLFFTSTVSLIANSVRCLKD
jgi:uncharacterized protein (TIGR02145 family)